MIARIHGRDAFTTLVRDGRRVRRPYLWCTWCPEPHSDVTRVGYSIGRACGPAVRRNRLRRRLRAIMRQIDQAQSLPPGIMMIGAKPAATELTFEALRTELEALMAAVRR